MDAASRRDGPDDLDDTVANAIDLVDHVGHRAAVVRDDGYYLANLGACLRFRQVDDPVFLGEVGYDGVRVLNDLAEARNVVLLAREYLGASVDNRAP